MKKYFFSFRVSRKLKAAPKKDDDDMVISKHNDVVKEITHVNLHLDKCRIYYDNR